MYIIREIFQKILKYLKEFSWTSFKLYYECTMNENMDGWKLIVHGWTPSMMMSTMMLVVMFGDDVDSDVENDVKNDVGHDVSNDVEHDTKHVIHDIVFPYNNKFHEEWSLGLFGYC